MAKAAKKFGDAFDEAQFRATNGRVLEYQAKWNEIHERYSKDMNDSNFEDLRQLILDCEIVCPISGTRNWTDVRQFNLMFCNGDGFDFRRCHESVSASGNGTGYFRQLPERTEDRPYEDTLSVSPRSVKRSVTRSLPVSSSSVCVSSNRWKCSSSFVRGEEMEWFKMWKSTRLKWHKAMGLGDQKYRYHDHEKLAHYANAATDIEYEMPFGFKEVEGIHSRTDFDLSQHEKFSGKKIQYFDPELNKSYTPYVIETSIGVDRVFLSVMAGSYCEETLENGETRVVLKLPAALAPIKLAVLPLVKKRRAS